MKVILPVIDNKEDKHIVAGSFHNADYVCIYDLDSEQYEWKETSAISKSFGNLSVDLKQNGIYTVISNYVPSMALRLFVESGLRVFRAKSGVVKDNIQMLMNGQLDNFTFSMASSGADGCSSSCSSCSSTTCN